MLVGGYHRFRGNPIKSVVDIGKLSKYLICLLNHRAKKLVVHASIYFRIYVRDGN